MWLNSVEILLWESLKTICSAWSTRSDASPGRSQPSRATSPPARMRPRRVAISRTIFA